MQSYTLTVDVIVVDSVVTILYNSYYSTRHGICLHIAHQKLDYQKQIIDTECL